MSEHRIGSSPMNDRLVIPIEFVQAMFPWTEQVGDKLLTPAGDEIPIITIEEFWDNEPGDEPLYLVRGEWPTRLQP